MINKSISSSELSLASAESKVDDVELQSLGVSVSSCPDITPEMLYAGAWEISLFSPEVETAVSAALRVYAAMQRVQKNPSNKTR